MRRGRTDPFQRLIEWYPAWWRRANGDVLLGALREQAEHEGRDAPSRGEVWSAAVNGVALRLDARLGLWSAVIGLLVGAGAWAMVYLGGGMWMGVVTTGLVPTFTLVGLVAVIRSRGWMTAPRAMLVLAGLTIALLFAALAQLSWAQGFRLADAGLPTTGFAAAFVPLFVAGLVIGAVGLAVLLEALFSRTQLPALPRVVLAVMLGGIAAPAIGIALVSPVVPAVVGVGVSLAALRTLGPRTPRTPRRAAPLAARARAGSLAAVRALAWLSVAGGLIGVAYAFTGTRWSAGAADGTAAMGRAITILLVSGIPLLAACGLAAPRQRARASVWGPIGLAVLALTATAIAYTAAPVWDDMSAGMFAAAGLGGAAVAWWVAPRVRGSLAARWAVGCAIGAAYAGILGIIAIPMLAFAVPMLGALVAIRARPGRAPRALRGTAGLAPAGTK